MAFSLGGYHNQTVTTLLATNHRDYATLMALSSSNQGIGVEAALEKLKVEMRDQSWSEYCSGLSV